MPKRILTGTVTSDANDQTVSVSVERRFKHPVLQKTIRKSKKYRAHDPENSFKIGENTIDILPRDDGSTAKALEYVPNIGGAGGGAMFSGQPRLVGERGSEIFVPHTNGTLLNNMNSKKAMGGGSPVNIYQTISFATGIVPTVRAEVTKMMPQIADVTKAAVQESAMRGGNFRRSLLGG